MQGRDHPVLLGVPETYYLKCFILRKLAELAVKAAARGAPRAQARWRGPPGSSTRAAISGARTTSASTTSAPAPCARWRDAIHAAHAESWSIDDAMAFADALIVDRFLEVKVVGIEIVARYRRDFTPALLPVWKRWLADDHSTNWATTDAICGYLIGPLLAQSPKLAADARLVERIATCGCAARRRSA